MPNYKVHFFIVNRPRPPAVGTSGPSIPAYDVEESQPAPTAAASYSQFLRRYQEILLDLFQQAVPHIPGNNAANALGWTIQISQIPQSSPGVPNWSGYTIQNFEPIVYLVGTTHNSAVQGPDRRATMAMLDALEAGRFRNVPVAEVRRMRTGMIRRTYTEGGIACIPWHQTGLTDEFRFAPVVAEVFANLTPMSAPGIFPSLTMPQMVRNWAEIVAGFTARASYHEIMHCKGESHNRPSGTTWSTVRSGSIHNEPGAGICAANVAFNTSPTAADYTMMGNHMLCPMLFYKLDTAVDTQCSNQGSPHTLTPLPPDTFDPNSMDI